MLPKKERLSRVEFNRFFSMGTRHHSPSCQIVYSPSRELHASVVVPKKVAARAVDRNKIRRRIYDIVRHHAHGTGMTGVFIFLTKPGVTHMKYAALRDEICAHMGTLRKKDYRV